MNQNLFDMRKHLIDKYGVRMTLKEASEVLKVPIGTLYNKRSKGKLGFQTYKDGMRVFVDTSELHFHMENNKDGFE